MNGDLLLKYSSKYGNWHDGIYYPESIAGLCSVLSTTLFDLSNTKWVIKGVNTATTLKQYKNHDEDNIWPFLFKTFPPHVNFYSSINGEQGGYDPGVVNSTDYLKTANLEKFKPFLKRYFTFSESLVKNINFLTEKYQIDYDNTIAIHYRTTDKRAEVETFPVERYIGYALKLLKEHKNLRIFLQTDDYFELQKLQYYFPKNSFYIKELPMSLNRNGVHINLLDKGHQNLTITELEDSFTKLSYAVNYLSSIAIISKCNHVITHVGNGAFWTALLRGSVNNFTQIC